MRVCVRVCLGAKQREQQRERESEQGRGRLYILSPSPPSSLVKPQEGGARPLAANQICSWQPALSQQQTIDRLHVKEFSA